MLQYNDAVTHDAAIIAEAYTYRHGHAPGPSDLMHFLFKRAAGNELVINQDGWTLQQVLEDIASAPTNNPNPVPYPIPGELEPPAGALQPLTIHDEMFHAGDAVWPWRMVTAFQLYKRYLDGEDLRPFLLWARSTGANGVRVLGMAHNLFRLYPQEYGAFYQQGIAGFCQLVAAYGLYIEWVVFADAQHVMNSSNVQQYFLGQMAEQLSPHVNVVAELVNEHSQNGVIPTQFGVPGGATLWSRGSDLSGKYPPYQAWNFVTYHSQRKDEWPRTAKDSHEIRDGVPTYMARHCPVVPNEMVGAGDSMKPWSRSNIPKDFYWYGATAQLMGAGATFHFENGLYANLPSPTQQRCAEAFFAGMTSVLPQTQKWHYTRGGLDDCPLEHNDSKALRTFAKIQGNQAEAIVIRPVPEWKAETRQGWRIVGQQGPRESRVSLTR